MKHVGTISTKIGCRFGAHQKDVLERLSRSRLTPCLAQVRRRFEADLGGLREEKGEWEQTKPPLEEYFWCPLEAVWKQVWNLLK